MSDNLALELSLAKIIDEMREQVEGHRRRNLILDSQLRQLGDLTIRLEALAETYEDVLRRMPEAPYLEGKITRLIKASLEKDTVNEPAEGQDIREMFNE